jgi:hypothetical protein
MYCLNALLIRSFGKIELDGQRKSIPKSLVEASLSNQVLDANPILSGKGVRKQTESNISRVRFRYLLVRMQMAGVYHLAVRAVKGAWFSRLSERSGRPLTGGAGGSGAGFSGEGRENSGTVQGIWRLGVRVSEDRMVIRC